MSSKPLAESTDFRSLYDLAVEQWEREEEYFGPPRLARSTASTPLDTLERQLPRLLTIKQTAALLQKSEKAIRRMIDRGDDLPVTRIGRRVRIRRDALLKKLKLQT